MIIRTANDWWNGIDKHWTVLRDILYMFLPVTKNETYEGEILTYPLSKYIEELKENKDRNLARYLNAAWSAAPDSPRIHSIPGWGVLCDLCSEEYVLYDDEEMLTIMQNGGGLVSNESGGF